MNNVIKGSFGEVDKTVDQGAIDSLAEYTDSPVKVDGIIYKDKLEAIRIEQDDEMVLFKPELLDDIIDVLSAIRREHGETKSNT